MAHFAFVRIDDLPELAPELLVALAILILIEITNMTSIAVMCLIWR
jgi:hypothetical protein